MSCLFSREEFDLLGLLREGASDEQLAARTLSTAFSGHQQLEDLGMPRINGCDPTPVVFGAGNVVSVIGGRSAVVITPPTIDEDPETPPVEGSIVHCELTAVAASDEIPLSVALTLAVLAVAPEEFKNVIAAELRKVSVVTLRATSTWPSKPLRQQRPGHI